MNKQELYKLLAKLPKKLIKIGDEETPCFSCKHYTKEQENVCRIYCDDAGCWQPNHQLLAMLLGESLADLLLDFED